jgi:hypothetical protein
MLVLMLMFNIFTSHPTTVSLSYFTVLNHSPSGI